MTDGEDVEDDGGEAPCCNHNQSPLIISEAANRVDIAACKSYEPSLAKVRFRRLKTYLDFARSAMPRRLILTPARSRPYNRCGSSPTQLRSGAMLNMPLRHAAITRFLLTILCLVAIASPLAPPSRSLAEDDILETFQGYLDPAPLGLDARYAWTLPGGRGENVRVCDIEYSWNLTHSDLIDAAANLFIYVKGVYPLPD